MFLSNRTNHLNPLLVEKNEFIFYIQNISEGNIIFDVGANVGELTLLFSKFTGPTGQVHAFEPTPATFEKLSKVVQNSNRGNVILNNLAVAAESGVVTFNMYEEQYASWNTVAHRPLENYGIHITNPTSVSLPAISIDDYCSKHSIEHIHLLKIDVEGAEYSVLQGAKRMFIEKRIGLCVFEFGQTIFDMGNTVIELQRLFKQYTYEVKNVSKSQNLYPVEQNTNLAIFAVHYARPK